MVYYSSSDTENKISLRTFLKDPEGDLCGVSINLSQESWKEADDEHMMQKINTCGTSFALEKLQWMKDEFFPHLPAATSVIDLQEELHSVLKQYQSLRAAQNDYFKQRKEDNSLHPSKVSKQKLAASKQLEKEMDAHVEFLLSPIS